MCVIDSITIDTISKFIMPMVFKDNIRYSDIPQKIYSTHLSIYDKPEYDDKIIIVSSSVLSKELYRPLLHIKSISSEEKEILNILEVPKEFSDDIEECINGRYSKLSERYKQKLLYFWQEHNKSKLFAVLYPNVLLRFSSNEYMENRYRIKKAKELYCKPMYIEFIYGLHKTGGL